MLALLNQSNSSFIMNATKSIRSSVNKNNNNKKKMMRSSNHHHGLQINSLFNNNNNNNNSTKKKQTVVITGASSGLGLYTTKALVETGNYVVIMACRNVSKAEQKAKELGFPSDSYSIMECELADLDSVRSFGKKFLASKYASNFSALICNAALYLPNATVPTFTKQGFEECVGVNHLAHHLLALMLLEKLSVNATKEQKRLIIVGSVTGNTNTLAGQVPPRANLGDMVGLKTGFRNADRNKNAMIDGERFIGAKAYKDSKLCNMLDVQEMARRYGQSTGVQFSTMYPGCIAESDLFRNHTPFFQNLFPIIQKYVTKGYVSETEAGLRLASLIIDPQYSEQGAYWSWKGGGDQLMDNYWDSGNREIAFNNKPSKEGRDMKKAAAVFDYSSALVDFKPSATMKSKEMVPASVA
jgi:protochlorophyllide reductase